MAPSETSILRNFLLPPIPLPVAISQEQFAAFFPRSAQSLDDVEILYHELQRQVEQGVEEVKANIAAEAHRGEKQKREMRSRMQQTYQAQIDKLEVQDIQMDLEMRDISSTELPLSEPYTEATIVPDIAQACEDIEQEIQDIEAETKAVLEDMKSTVGNLSDLRYGKLPQVPGSDDSIADDLLENLQRLEKVCQEAAG